MQPHPPPVKGAALFGGSSDLLLFLAILLTAFCLRGPITAIAPLFSFIQAELQLTATQIGILTTLPLLAFSLAAPLSARLGVSYGARRCIMVALVGIALSIVVRSSGSVWALYGATLTLGIFICVANVLLPAIIKRDYPGAIGPMTATYALFMNGAAGLASVFIIPLAEQPGWSWRLALLAGAIFPALAALLWLLRLGPQQDNAPPASVAGDASVWRSAIGWAVTVYFGLIVFVHYAAIAWLPAMLTDAGQSRAEAGAMHGWMQVAGGISGAALIPLLHKTKDQRALALASPGLAAIGLAGLILSPQAALLWVLMIGAGLGATFVLALAFFGLRTASSRQAAGLSGMAQGAGYLFVATAPVAIAGLHTSSGNWLSSLAVMCVMCSVAAVLGLVVGRANRQAA